MNDPILAWNFEKIKELQPNLIYAATGWITDCWNCNCCFRIAEVYRSQERQADLWKVGRRGIKNESPVTWTKTSEHVKRTAVDLDPINCSFEQIEEVARRYGIYRPPELLKLGDYRHFSFAKAVTSEEMRYSPEAQEKRLGRALQRVSGPLKDMLIRQLERLKKRIS